jgi:Ca2+-transporting ATPase
MVKNFYNYQLKDVYDKLNTSEKGLSSEEASARLQRNGKNALEEGKSKTWIQRFFAQMKDLMIIVLLVASLISGVIAIVEASRILAVP